MGALIWGLILCVFITLFMYEVGRARGEHAYRHAMRRCYVPYGKPILRDRAYLFAVLFLAWCFTLPWWLS